MDCIGTLQLVYLMEPFSYLEGLRAYFEQFGQVTECVIMKDPTGRSRCFGFVSFSDPEVLDSLLQKTHILDKKQVNLYAYYCHQSFRSIPNGLFPKTSSIHLLNPLSVLRSAKRTKFSLVGYIWTQMKQN